MPKQTVLNRIESFCKQQANAPIVATVLVRDAIEHFAEHRDWDALAYFIGHAPSAMSKMARIITGKVMTGVTLDTKSKAAKQHRCKCQFIIHDTFGLNQDPAYLLSRCVDDGFGLTSKDIKEAFGIDTSTPFDFDKFVKAEAKKIVDNNVSIADFVQALSAEIEKQRADNGLAA